MHHTVELLAILLLMALGQCAVDPSPRLLRRTLYSFGWSILAFAAAIVIISIPSVAASAVQLAGIVLAIYLLRWLIGGIVDHFTGPLLMEMPGRGDVAAAASSVTGAPLPDAQRAASRILRRNEGYLALAALQSLDAEDAANLETAWQAACDRERDALIELARALGGATAPDRVSSNAVRFLAQAFCMYERESAKRVLGKLKECRLASRAGRERAAEALEKQALRGSRAAQLGLPSRAGEEKPAASALRPATLLWPAGGVQRLGFRSHALALHVCEAALILYGVIAVVAGHGFYGNSGYVFLGVALLIHIQTLFAIGDFAYAACPSDAETAGSA